MHCAEISAGAEESAHLISRRFWQNESVTRKAFQYLEYFGFPRPAALWIRSGTVVAIVFKRKGFAAWLVLKWIPHLDLVT
jgi:hypothetical protein